jgi:hypothetical protein
MMTATPKAPTRSNGHRTLNEVRGNRSCVVALCLPMNPLQLALMGQRPGSKNSNSFPSLNPEAGSADVRVLCVRLRFDNPPPVRIVFHAAIKCECSHRRATRLWTAVNGSGFEPPRKANCAYLGATCLRVARHSAETRATANALVCRLNQIAQAHLFTSEFLICHSAAEQVQFWAGQIH